MEIMHEDLVNAVREKIAAEVVNNLSTKEKENLVASGIKEVITGWKFKNVLENEIQKIATSDLRQYLDAHDVREKIRVQAVLAAEQFVGILDKAILGTLLEMLDGDRADSYNKPKVYKKVRQLLNIEN